MVAIRVHFDGKVLVPDEPLDLPPNQALIAHLDVAPLPQGYDAGAPEAADTPDESATDWMIRNAVPALPSDGARQHDHYLYGTSKRTTERREP